MTGSVEAISPVAAPNRPVGSRWPARMAKAGRRTRKEFRPSVADNPLISPDSLPKMEGNGSILGPFLSSRARLGRAHNAFWKLTGAQGVLRECLRGRSVGPQMAPQRLENIDSAPENGMAPAALDPQDLVEGRGPRRGRRLRFVGAVDDRARRAQRARLQGRRPRKSDSFRRPKD